MTTPFVCQREQKTYDSIDIDIDYVKETIRQYELLSLKEKYKFIYKNRDDIVFFCRYAPWNLLDNKMLFVLHVAYIYGRLDILPKRIREYNRSIIINQILIYIENQYMTLLLMKKLPISRYLIPHILKLAEINMKIPIYLINVLRPANYKKYRSLLSCRETPLQLNYWALTERLADPQIKIYDKYTELLEIMKICHTKSNKVKIKKKIQEWIQQRVDSLYNRSN